MENNKLLLIDDDTQILEVLTDLFDGTYEVQTATCGASGLLKIDSFDPYVVLSDIHMDGMDGLQMLEAMRAKNDGRHVILFTSFGDQEEYDRATAHKVFGFVDKPIHEKQLKVLLQEAFSSPYTTQKQHQRPAVQQNGVDTLETRKFLHDVATPLSVVKLNAMRLEEDISEKGMSSVTQEVLLKKLNSIINAANKIEGLQSSFRAKITKS